MIVLIVPLWNWSWWIMICFQVLLRFNRTFMELKLFLPKLIIKNIQVLIVPLWNWNVSFSNIICNIRFVLIVPLWNWNWCCLFWTCYNRYVLIVPLWNWNYLRHLEYHLKQRQVLIVPLWNWNKESVVLLSKLICFNRTFMELKCSSTT